MDLFEDKIFNNDALYMKSLIGKTVRINTVEGKQFTGIVYVIDPIYKTIVLNSKKIHDNKHDTVLILHQAIKSLEVVSDEIEESYLESDVSDVLNVNSSESSSNKVRLKKWLQKMYIDVDEVGEYLKIDDNLLIMPPYGLENCLCNNTIILAKVQNIIGLMPEDFQ